ncbi:MAG: hypothetical protein DWI24_10600 [Planctomycetota bacterium]|nr:MAG: hypothetical protein DWI24_10600 [Planctomycetota bacterium]
MQSGGNLKIHPCQLKRILFKIRRFYEWCSNSIPAIDSRHRRILEIPFFTLSRTTR